MAFRTAFRMVSLPIRQEVLNVSPPAISSMPDCNNTADVPTFTVRTALSAITLVSDLSGVDVQ